MRLVRERCMGRPGPSEEREREIVYECLIHPPQKFWFPIDLLSIHLSITLLKAITVFCGTENIIWNIPHI